MAECQLEMGCFSSKPRANPIEEQKSAGAASENTQEDTLAKNSHFSRDEVESLKELYHKISNELHHDGLIHKDELSWALFKCHKDNLFVDRVFELFDIKQNNVIEFEEFVLSLSVFHPNAPLEEKARCTPVLLLFGFPCLWLL